MIATESNLFPRHVSLALCASHRKEHLIFNHFPDLISKAKLLPNSLKGNLNEVTAPTQILVLVEQNVVYTRSEKGKRE